MNSIIRILLLEDDQADHLLMTRLLSRIPGQSYELEWVRSCAEALEVLAQEEHDIGLVDYDLPDGCGIEVIRQAVERGLAAPMVLLTGHSSREVDLKAMKAGASDFLVKGEFTAQLLERIPATGVLEGHRELSGERLQQRLVLGGELAPVGPGAQQQRAVAPFP